MLLFQSLLNGKISDITAKIETLYWRVKHFALMNTLKKKQRV